MDEVRMDRRKFLGGAAGVGAAAALASWAPGALSKPGGPNAPIVSNTLSMVVRQCWINLSDR